MKCQNLELALSQKQRGMFYLNTNCIRLQFIFISEHKRKDSLRPLQKYYFRGVRFTTKLNAYSVWVKTQFIVTWVLFCGFDRRLRISNGLTLERGVPKTVVSGGEICLGLKEDRLYRLQPLTGKQLLSNGNSTTPLFLKFPAFRKYKVPRGQNMDLKTCKINEQTTTLKR